MKITIATLIYRSAQYLDFVMNSLLENSSNKHEVEYLIVCNDATEDVIEAAMEWAGFPSVRTVIHNNKNPDAWWIQNVYNAWNRCLEECNTEAICFVNSDMAFSDGWLDALAKYDLDSFIPTSLLVESGRMPSLKGLISKNFGRKLSDFDKDKFDMFAKKIKKNEFERSIGAYMPSLFNTEKLRSLGGWRKNMAGMPGDKITFAICKNAGIEHIMVKDSLVYHFQRGESAETGDLK